ncbi:hypothetical protein YC2023_123102 [Brassica napus]
MNSLFIHSCRISRDDHVPQPRIMSETDATTAALQAILNASINFFFIIFFCFIMYKVEDFMFCSSRHWFSEFIQLSESFHEAKNVYLFRASPLVFNPKSDEFFS